MNQAIVCDFCNETFTLEPKGIETTTVGDLEIQYFTCPKCHRKFLVLATDPEMRELIARRQEIAAKIKVARVAKARPKSFKRLTKELDAVVKAQERKLAELKRLGRKALREVAAP